MSQEGESLRQQFPQTSWTLVELAADDDKPHRPALGELLSRYLLAMKAHLVLKKRIAAARAEDLVQAFIADKILERSLLSDADRSRGRFRSFLLTALDNFVSNQVRAERAKARSPDSPLLDIDEQPVPATAGQPSDAFDAAWAGQLIGETLKKMHAECAAKSRLDIWEVFRSRVIDPILLDEESTSYQQLVARFGFQNPMQVHTALVTAERGFRRILRAVVGEYTTDDQEIDEEIRNLKAILSSSSAQSVLRWCNVFGGLSCEATVCEDAPDSRETNLLAQMMEVGAGDRRVWRPEELSAVYRHQLGAPVLCDLESLDPGLAAKLRTLCASEGLLLKSFADLFFHPNPPVELLELTKQFGKSHSNQPDSILPHEIAVLLYVASIVVAMTRCEKRITELGDAELRSRIEWFLQQPWIDGNMRALLGEGLAQLSKTGATSP